MDPTRHSQLAHKPFMGLSHYPSHPRLPAATSFSPESSSLFNWNRIPATPGPSAAVRRPSPPPNVFASSSTNVNDPTPGPSTAASEVSITQVSTTENIPVKSSEADVTTDAPQAKDLPDVPAPPSANIRPRATRVPDAKVPPTFGLPPKNPTLPKKDVYAEWKVFCPLPRRNIPGLENDGVIRNLDPEAAISTKCIEILQQVATEGHAKLQEYLKMDYTGSCIAYTEAGLTIYRKCKDDEGEVCAKALCVPCNKWSFLDTKTLNRHYDSDHHQKRLSDLVGYPVDLNRWTSYRCPKCNNWVRLDRKTHGCVTPWAKKGKLPALRKRKRSLEDEDDDDNEDKAAEAKRPVAVKKTCMRDEFRARRLSAARVVSPVVDNDRALSTSSSGLNKAPTSSSGSAVSGSDAGSSASSSGPITPPPAPNAGMNAVYGLPYGPFMSHALPGPSMPSIAGPQGMPPLYAMMGPGPVPFYTYWPNTIPQGMQMPMPSPSRIDPYAPAAPLNPPMLGGPGQGNSQNAYAPPVPAQDYLAHISLNNANNLSADNGNTAGHRVPEPQDIFKQGRLEVADESQLTTAILQSVQSERPRDEFDDLFDYLVQYGAAEDL